MEALPLRTGRTNCVTSMQRDMAEQTLAIVASMMQQAAHDATLYCAEAKRTVIMPRDIELALKRLVLVEPARQHQQVAAADTALDEDAVRRREPPVQHIAQARQQRLESVGRQDAHPGLVVLCKRHDGRQRQDEQRHDVARGRRALRSVKRHTGPGDVCSSTL